VNMASLKDTADRLDALLRLYSKSNQQVEILYRQLSSFISDASSGKIKSPVDLRQIPCSRMFTETDLPALPGLEDAFAKFKLEVSGGENQDDREVRRLFESRHGLGTP
jgi:hypothetical protein